MLTAAVTLRSRMKTIMIMRKRRINKNVLFLLHAVRGMRDAYKVEVGECEWKRPRGRPRCKW
jgi:hypothetical protein